MSKLVAANIIPLDNDCDWHTNSEKRDATYDSITSETDPLMRKFIPELFSEMNKNAVVIVFGEAARAAVDGWKCFDHSKMIQGEDRLPHLCVLVNNRHNENHRKAITDVVAKLAGKLLGEPPVRFESEADRDEILKVAFANTDEGKKFRKIFLEMAESPDGLADLYKDSASWSPGKAKYAEKLHRSLFCKRDQIIAAIKSCIRDNGTIDNDKLLADFGEKTQKHVLTYLRRESNRYSKTAEGRKFRKIFLEMAESPDGLADLYKDSASWSPGKTKYTEKLHESVVSKRDHIIAAIKSCIRDNGTIDNDKLLADFGEKTQKQVLTYLRRESNRYLNLAMDTDSGTEISDEYLLPLMTMKFDFSAFLANDPSTQLAAHRAETNAKVAALIRDDGTFDFDAYEELDGNTKRRVMVVIKDRCTEYTQLKSSNGNVNAAEISDECLLRMIAVTFDVDSFFANDPSTQLAAHHAETNAKTAALIRDDGTFDFDAYDELDGNTKRGVMNVIKDRCIKYEQLQSSDDDGIPDECLRRMIAVKFSVSAFQEGKREKPKKWSTTIKRAAQYAETNAKAAALIRDNGTFDFDAYEELDGNTKKGVITTMRNKCTEYEQLQPSDDGVNIAKISDECLYRMIAVKFDVSAFQEGKRENKLKRKREDNKQRRLNK